MERLDRLESPALPVAIVNCDTDQILPAQYLQKLRSENFGPFLFRQLRFRDDGSEVEDFVLNRAPYRAARVLVADRNFACGSSREHAVWALYDYGFRVVIAPSFGDIFFANSLKNGLLPIVLPQQVVSAELEALARNPGAMIAVDLPEQTVRLSGGAIHSFEVNAFAKRCLLSGLDELGYTLAHSDEIDAFEARYESGR
ncbi:3-isopropylmalate dehydratase small subunit [Methylobacterium nodulans]|uniref:3-isopropylmalate dehydratase small subunit n=1 Tax=Methylobacterium nodulans (strain LMG 21967 / CNCM I-2342 / ORS 2060) TaxID=460265 RepID=B8IA12_METNO|nr:3-isopropylmalate dehydratase small subunit [Methylobacterium nodulans]ACL57240.1 3-isopropylmalate dehydratase, small subunit [Methylobacterium nodulans ORS 2060]